MVRLHQIVAGIPAVGDSPVVLFDFDEWFTLGVGTDFSPPDVRASNVWTQLNDGETTGASTLGDRVIRLVLTQFRGNAEDQAEVLQTLGGLLNDPRGQWFLWQDEGTVHERFFRTKRAPLSIEDHHLLEKPKRTVTVSIPAEPGAYGRAITGQQTVANDPTAGTNPMSFTLTDIKGDMPAPLWLRYVGTTGDLYASAMAAGGGPSQPDSPPYDNTIGSGAVSAGWNSITTPADATAIGGVKARFVKTSGVLTARGSYSFTAPHGDYRVFLRVSAPVGTRLIGGMSWLGVTMLPAYQVRTVENTGWGWIDFGVWRVSSQGMLAVLPGIVDPGMVARGFGFEVDLPTPTGTVDVNGGLLLPVGLDDSITASYLVTDISPEESAYLAYQDVNINGYIDQAWAGDATKFINLVAAGGFPEVVPGTENVLYLVRQLAGLVADDKTRTCVVDWLYYPRYLYIRSATG